MPKAPRWLLVSKPLRPPLDDGTSRLCDTLVRAFPADRPLSYFGDPSQPLRGSQDEVIPRAPMGHAPTLTAKADLLRELARPSRRHQPIHAFFTPNSVTSRVLVSLRRLVRGRSVVQTVTSSDGVDAFVGLLKPLDRVITLSDDARDRLVNAGLDSERVVRIYPGVPHVIPQRESAPRRMIFAGDLDDEVAQRLIAIGLALDRPELAGWTLVIACRPKGDSDARARGEIRRRLADEIRAERVELHGRVPDFDRLLRGCGLQIFVATHARKKVDLPLAVLEGLARGLGVLMLDVAPMNEIIKRAHDHGLAVGQAIPAEELVNRLAEVCADPSLLQRWRSDAPRLIEAEFTSTRMADAYARLHADLD
jgi:glycosyltransferase involved in cell wall biosynthesis